MGGGRLEVFVYLTEVIFPHANRFPGHLAIWIEARLPPPPPPQPTPFNKTRDVVSPATFCEIRLRSEVTKNLRFSGGRVLEIYRPRDVVNLLIQSL